MIKLEISALNTIAAVKKICLLLLFQVTNIQFSKFGFLLRCSSVPNISTVLEVKSDDDSYTFVGPCPFRESLFPLWCKNDTKLIYSKLI
jgi:hypothetical protein